MFECALYVNRIRNGWFPPSLQVNYEGCKSVLINFKHWGEAIGSKLEELEDSEHDKVQEEEPVLPREAAKGTTCVCCFVTKSRTDTRRGWDIERSGLPIYKL